MSNTGRIVPGLIRSCAERLRPSQSVPAKGVSFVVFPHVVVGPGRCAGRLDVAAHFQAHHRGFRSAEFLDGDRQGPEDRLGAAAAGALPRPSRSSDGADPDVRAKILVRRRDRLSDSHHGRPRQGTLYVDIRSVAGTSLVWTLIGVDQALHHLTGFGLSIYMSANA